MLPTDENSTLPAVLAAANAMQNGAFQAEVAWARQQVGPQGYRSVVWNGTGASYAEVIQTLDGDMRGVYIIRSAPSGSVTDDVDGPVLYIGKAGTRRNLNVGQADNERNTDWTNQTLRGRLLNVRGRRRTDDGWQYITALEWISEIAAAEQTPLLIECFALPGLAPVLVESILLEAYSRANRNQLPKWNRSF